MPEFSTITPEFAAFLQRERRRILPFVGAGVSVDAGVPAAAELAPLITQRARDSGADIPDGADFTTVCALVTEQLTHLRLQEITAEVVGGLEITPTPLQRLIVRCPLRTVVTTNYEPSLAMAAHEAGLEPIIRTPDQARALERPGDGQVLIVYLHGTVERPETIALPGESMVALAGDEALKTILRALVAPHVVVYLGYRLPPDDDYLREEMRTLQAMFADRGPHRVLLSLDEAERRRDDLTELRQNAEITVETFDSTLGYQAVQQAALIIAPANTREAPGEHLSPVRQNALASYYLPPSILPVETEGERDPDARLAIAQMGFGSERLVTAAEIVEAHRAVVVAEPGMGKTQFLYRLGVDSTERDALFVRLSDLSGQLQEDDDEPERLLTAVLQAAKVFRDDARAPSRDSLDDNAYLLLFDALDEVPAERRARVLSMLDRIAERYAQHVIVVTSRVNDQAFALADESFTAFRIARDADWGRRYLVERGIVPERIERLYDEAHTITDLLAVPQYATLIGERLAEEELRPLPATAFALMTDVAVRDVVEGEANKLGYPPDAVYRWLETLAVVLELRGRTTAATAELAAIPAPNELRGPDTRDRLIERALLRDVPDIAALQTNAIQEALAAQAILESGDPLQTLRDATVATLRGEATFRDDLDHAIDLFFEGAPSELRPPLRELDELRWARTARADAPEDEVADALETIWRIYRDRQVWIDRNRGREIRDARSAVERLARAAPDRARAMRAEWAEATFDGEPTMRANGAFFLQQLGYDDETADWLVPLFTDHDPVVRRHAAMAAAGLRPPEGALTPELGQAYLEDHDELAAETIGLALFDMAASADRATVVRLLRENPIGWGRIRFLLTDLTVADALSVLADGGISTGEDERLLSQVAAKVPVNEWVPDNVRLLVALVVESSRRYYREFQEQELLEELARAHPDAALAGASEGASSQTNWHDLYFLRGLSRERLRDAAHGTLEQPLLQLIDFLDPQRQPPEPAPRPEVQPQDEPTLAGRLLDESFVETTRIRGIPQPLLEGFLHEVAELDEGGRLRLTEAVAAWWPDDLSTAITIEGSSGSCPWSLPPALAFSEALDLPLGAQRWLEIFASGAVWFWWGSSRWMRRHYPQGREDEVVAVVAGLNSEEEVRRALDSLPELGDHLADAFANAILRINADESTYLLDRFRDAGQLDALRRIRDEAESTTISRAAQRELAHAGDVDAQRRELQMMVDEVGANPDAYSLQGFQWAGEARLEVIGELRDLLRAVAAANPPSGDLQRRVQSALAATRSEEALVIYDELIVDADVEGASFYRYQRDELARALARDEVLARLPTELGDVAVWMAERGFAVDS